MSSVSPKCWRRSECPDDDVGYADGCEHGSVDFSGEGAFLFPIEVLCADGDVGAFGGSDGSIDAEVGGADEDFVPIVAVNQRKEVAEEVTGLVGSFVHLPISGDEFLSHEGPFSKITEMPDDSREIFSAART